MEIKTIIEDRAAIVRFLESKTGERADYAGAPTFNYQIGPYTVLRNGNIRVSDEKADRALIQKLIEAGYAVDEAKRSAIETELSYRVTTRVNLINMLASKGELINKAIDQPNAFYMSKALVKRLKNACPTDLTDFNETLVRAGGGRATRGIEFLSDKVLFTGFPEGRPEQEFAAFQDLANGMVASCETAAWVKADPVQTINERYTFRGWMNSIGMDGSEHRETRRVLMQHLDGNAAFRTEAQQEKARNHRLKRKEAERHEPARESDFIVLG